MAVEKLRISHTTNSHALASVISGLVCKGAKIELELIGAGALNQAVKAIAIARGDTTPAGCDLVFRPAFSEIHIDDHVRTALRLMLDDESYRK